MIIASLAEVLSIGAVLPLLGVLVNPEKVFNSFEIQFIVSFLGVISAEEFIFVVTVAFCITALIAGALRFILMFFQLKLSYSVGAEFSIALYERILHQSYITHIGRNSSEIVSSVISKTNQMVYGLLYPSVALIASILMILMILTTLFLVNPYIAISALVGFGAIYGTVIYLTKKHILIDGEIIDREQTAAIKAVQDGIGAIRDILIAGNQAIYVKKYAKSEIALRHSQSNIQMLGTCPRFLIEALAMILIALLALFMLKSAGGREMVIPTLGVLAISAQRLLPLLQQSYSSWTQIQSSKSIVLSVLKILERPINYAERNIKVIPLSFQKSLVLSNIHFSYEMNGHSILKGVNFEIKNGDRVGIIGDTGSGKSTLLDIIMGLISPTKGEVIVDDIMINDENRHSWQVNIAHVPQDIFLVDGSIAENIAFGCEKSDIDYVQVERAISGAMLSEVVDKLPSGYMSMVGEKGVRLSGGQKQRIGIARALYQNAQLIIFDEATSALDMETESEVMQSIKLLSAKITMVVVAHRLTTLRDCNKIIKISQGTIQKSGSYNDVIGAKS